MNDTPLVSRTYRAAIRSGDDYITIEETIALPPTASDAEIAQAVDTGLRIFRMQQAAVEAQIANLRDAHPASAAIRIADPDAPASEKQRSYLEYLVTTLELPDNVMQTTLREHNTSYEALTKGQASEIIDKLKSQLDQKPIQSEVSQAPQQAAVGEPTTVGAPASTRQLAALQKVAQQHGVDLAAEIRSRFGAQQLDDLNSTEAGSLLQELQQRGSRR